MPDTGIAVVSTAGADVTINTRDAYADIMNMFSDSLAVQGGSRKRACNASTSGRAGAGSAFAEPLFEVYEGDASPAASPGPGEAGDADLPAADADAYAFAVFEDEPDEAGCGEYASDAENEDPLRQHYPAPPATDAPDDSLVFRPWSADELRGSGGENGEPLDAEMHAAAEAALCAGAGPAELLAQDSFEVYQDTAAFPAGDATRAVPQLSFAAAPASMLDGGFEVYEDTTAVPPVAFSADITADFINPFSPAAVAQMLASLDEPVSVMQGVTVEDESAAAKLESSLSGARRHPHSGVVLQLGGFKYVLGKLCGRGAYADIYEAVDEDDADDFADAGSSAPVLALKVVRPPDAAAVSWEFVVLRRVAERVPHVDRQLFLQARRLHMAGPLSVLVAAFGPHGTLQDGVNAMLAADRGGMHESLAMYFTVELLRALEVLHSAAFIHGDVKPDNVLLRFGGSQWEEWAPSRPGQWRERGVSLIDFGRSIDLTAHAPNAAFMGDCGTDNFRCVEMIAGKPWTFQADTFGALGCVHAMLFGTYMEVDLDERSGRWRRREPLKRYWRTELWEPLFDDLLNVPSCQQQPELRRFRAAFEEHLAAPARAAEVRSKLMELTIVMAEQAAKAAKAA
jgi:checkpoint serine/threonine-protein kinase